VPELQEPLPSAKGRNLVTEQQFHRRDHYVPRMYLKPWTTNGRVWAYRILVPHEKMPTWTQKSSKAVAYHAHLYTCVVASGETDDFERWLDAEFEAPAAGPLQKVVSGARLARDDWQHLIRFVAAQDVRTPARLLQHLRWCDKNVPDILETTLKKTVGELEEAHRAGKRISRVPTDEAQNFPVRITKHIEPGEEMGQLKAEIIVGRDLWLWSMKRMLTHTAKVLHEHKWAILRPPPGMHWITSDNPVIRLNYYQPGRYDFRGGWGNPGSEILLPVGPQHLLYTQIGKRPSMRGEVSLEHARLIRSFTAQHAHRLIFACERDPEVERLRPRVVDPDAFRDENEKWRGWHQEQSAAQRELMGLGSDRGEQPPMEPGG